MRKYTWDMCTGVHLLRVEGHHSSTHGRKPLGLQSLRRGVFLLRAVIQGGKLVNSDTPNSTDEPRHMANPYKQAPAEGRHWEC